MSLACDYYQKHPQQEKDARRWMIRKSAKIVL